MAMYQLRWISLVFTLSVPAIAFSSDTVRIGGALLIYDVAGPVEWKREKVYKIRFSLPEPTSVLSIPDEVGVDRYFHWVVKGNLLEDKSAKVL